MTERPRLVTQTLSELKTEALEYLLYYIDKIKSLPMTATGRKLVEYLITLVETNHFGLDFRFRQSNLQDVTKVEHALRVVSVINYQNPGPAAATSQGIFEPLGAAPVAPVPIPQYTVLKTTGSPTLQGITADAAVLGVGETSVEVGIIQGQRYTAQALGVATGGPYQSYPIATRYIPKAYLAVYVNAVAIPVADDFQDYDDTELVCKAVYDYQGYLTLEFPDGTYGKPPDIGDVLTADWVVCEGKVGNFDMSQNQYRTIIGALSSTLSFTQIAASTNGAYSPTVQEIKDEAPGHYLSYGYVRNVTDCKPLAEAYPGVYKVKVRAERASHLAVYVMPDGGGTASLTLLTNLESYLQGIALEGLVVECFSLTPVPMIGAARVVLATGRPRVSRGTISRMVWDALAADIEYQTVAIGRGQKMSDIAQLIEEIGDGGYIDYADILQLSREPRFIKNRIGAPDVYNFLVGTALTTAQSWLVIAFDATQYFVSVGGATLQALGTVGVPYTSGGLTFTIGTTVDTLQVGDEYDLVVSPYLGNIVLRDDEYQYFRQDSDFGIDVVYAEEDA